MDRPQLPELDPAIASAIEAKGYSELTAVQKAVLQVNAQEVDLRISSQTGSGKTVAIGLAIYPLILAAKAARPAKAEAPKRAKAEPSAGAGPKGKKMGTPPEPGAGPLALVVAPTRELARQVEQELTWLFAGIHGRVISLTGGSSYTAEFRALHSRPHVVVGTPGRLVDHLERESLDLSQAKAVVLDEADRMLDMGFRDALDAILSKVDAEGCRKHLVSATYPPEVIRLAARVQNSPVSIEGTRLGVANADIEHLVYPVHAPERFAALVNVLLQDLNARALIFVKMRASVAELAQELSEAGFAVSAISGDMEQRERNRSLENFRSGRARIMVATDVAARGLDVPDVSMVIHFDPPTDPDDYTHRSGRTGRAGKRGQSILLAAPRELSVIERTLHRARIKASIQPPPDQDTLRAAQAEQLWNEMLATRSMSAALEGEQAAEPNAGDTASTEKNRRARRGEAAQDTGASEVDHEADERALIKSCEQLAERVLRADNARDIVARLIKNLPHFSGPQARKLSPVTLRAPSAKTPVGKHPGSTRLESARHEGSGRAPSPRHSSAREDAAPHARAPRSSGARETADTGSWQRFKISYGAKHGADARRILAMVCRRGNIGKREIGSIRVQQLYSEVEVAARVADEFARAVQKPDPRDPRVTIKPRA